MHMFYCLVFTLPETNIAPENGWLEDYFPFGMTSWQLRLLLVSGSVRLFQLVVFFFSWLDVHSNITANFQGGSLIPRILGRLSG